MHSRRATTLFVGASTRATLLAWAAQGPETERLMEIVTFDHLGEVPDGRLAPLITLFTDATRAAVAESPRVAQVFATLGEVLQNEQDRREGRLPHSAPSVPLHLATAGELSDNEMRDVMRWMLESRTRVGGGVPAVATFFDTALRTLDATRAHQRTALERMGEDFP